MGDVSSGSKSSSSIVYQDNSHPIPSRSFSRISAPVSGKRPWLHSYQVAVGFARYLIKNKTLAHCVSPFVYLLLCWIQDSVIEKPFTSHLNPIVVFSHGLAGTRFMYSQFASYLCSKGMDVVALEHQDGSALLTTNAESSLFYQHPPAANPRELRQNQLKIRSQELIQMILHLRESYPNRILYLAGHSFGGCSSYIAASELAQLTKIDKVLLIDPWWHALDNHELELGHAFQNTTVYACFTERFHWDEQDRQTKKIADSLGSSWKELHCPGTRHQDLSDLSVYLPGIMKNAGFSAEEGGLKHIQQVVDFFLSGE
jgi:pimeloyl-ACP methyl ester carboxylesterase